MSTGRQVIKNAGALTLARGVTATITLVTTVYLGRVLGPEVYGILAWGLALVEYLKLLPIFGLNVHGVRVVARDPTAAAAFVGASLPLRVATGALAYGVLLLVIFLLPRPPTFRLTLALLGLILFQYAISVEFVYEGLQRMGVLAVRHVTVAVLSLGAILAFVRGPEDVPYAAAALALSVAGGNVWLLATYLRGAGRVPWSVSWQRWRPLILSGLPIMTSLLMIAVYTSMDQLMLGLLRPGEEVGWYGAGYRLVVAATIPMQILVQAFMPTLSAAAGDPAAMRTRGGALVRVLLGLGLSGAVVGAFLAPYLMGLFGAAYAPGVPALTILLAGVAVTYGHAAFGRALIAWDRERLYMGALIAGAVLNVVLNLLLIPRFGTVGAAAATVVSEGVVLVGAAWGYARTVGTLHGAVLLRAALTAGLGVALPAAAASAFGAPLPLLLAAMGAGFAAAALASGLVGPDTRALLHTLRR